MNLQKSKWNRSDEVAFTVNLAIVAAPWFDWDAHRGLVKRDSKLREYHGLWREWLNPSPSASEDREFWIVRDEASAEASGVDVATKLADAGLPRLNSLLNRAELMTAIRAGDFGMFKIPPLPPLAVMLSDSGPSPELDRVLADLNTVPGWAAWDLKDDFVNWVRQRAEHHVGEH